jgi:methionine synthase II (cobalamin-independent)
LLADTPGRILRIRSPYHTKRRHRRIGGNHAECDQGPPACHHHHRLAAAISKDKKIAIGVISHRTLQIETPEEVAADIRRALKLIAPERLIINTDCGFGRQGLGRKHAFFKMVALVRGTNIVRRELGLAEAPVLVADQRLAMF